MMSLTWSSFRPLFNSTSIQLKICLPTEVLKAYGASSLKAFLKKMCARQKTTNQRHLKIYVVDYVVYVVKTIETKHA